MKKSLLLSMMVVLLSLIGCQEETEFLNPGVTVEPAGVTETSLSFKITPEEAKSCAFLCVEAGSEVPSAEAILQSGKPADAQEASVQTVENLTASTRYIIVAAAEANGIKVASRTISMTTAVAPSPDANPSVEVTAMESTSSSFSFEVNPREAVKCSYVCIEGKAKVPEASAIIADGVRILPNQKSEQIETGLEPNTDYVIVAAVQNGDKYNTAELKFKTPEGNVTEFIGNQAKGRKGVHGNFFVQIKNAQKTVALDFYGPEDAETLVAGTYKFATDKSEFSILSTTSTFGTKDEFTTFVAGEAKVELEEENYAISFNLIQQDGSVIRGSYEGEIDGMFVEFPSFHGACSLPITDIKADHTGSEAILTITLGENQYVITFDMLFTKQDLKLIPYGDYRVEDRTNEEADSTPFITKVANITDMTTGKVDTFQIGAGFVNVSANEEGQWVITMTDLLTESYLKYNNEYAGPIKGLDNPTAPVILTVSDIYYTPLASQENKVMSLSMQGADYSFEGTFDFQVRSSDKYLKPGTYTLGEGVNTFKASGVSIRKNPDQFIGNPANVKQGSKIIVTLENDVYNIVCDLILAFTDYNDPSVESAPALYKFVYNGKIDNMIQPDLSDVTITGGYLECTEWTPGEPYYSYWDDSAKFFLEFSNGSKLSLYAKFPKTGAKAGSYYIPEGSYIVKTVPWDENGDFTLDTYTSQFSVNDGVQNLAEGGVVDIAYAGEDYVIKLDVETTYGIVLKQEYKGQIKDLVVPSGSEGGDEFTPQAVYTADMIEYSLEMTESGLREYNLGLYPNDNSFNGSIRVRSTRSDVFLQPGTYTYGEDGEMTFDLISFANEEKGGLADTGTLTVELSEETYTLTVDFVLKVTKMSFETWEMVFTGEEIPYRMVYTGLIDKMFQPDLTDQTITGGHLNRLGSDVCYWGDSCKFTLDYSNENHLTLYFKFPQTNVEAGQYFIPEGVYIVKFVSWGEDASFTLEPNSCIFENNEGIQRLMNGGTIEVAYDGSDYSLSLNLVTEYGINLNHQYKGQITDLVVPGTSGGGEEFVPEKVFTADAVEYTLNLSELGLREYNLGLLANDNSFNTSLRVRGKQSDARLQAGNYTFGYDGEMTFDITSFSSSESAGIVDNGTLQVELSGETYTITADFILKVTKMNWETFEQEPTGEEIPYRVVYTGTINRMSQPDVSDLTITGGYVESYSWGLSYWGDSAKLYLTYSDGSKQSLYLKFPQTNAAEGQYYLPAGTYEVKMVPWGENADFTVEPNSSQFYYGDDLQSLLQVGTVDISYDGNDYVFNIDVITAFGITLNKQYKGQITDLVVPAI